MDVHADDPDNHPRTPTRPVANPCPIHLTTHLTTPQGFGSGILSSYDDDKELGSKGPYHRTDYDAHIQHDLRNNRVFMDTEKFIELVFRQSADSENDSSRSAALTAITGDANFQNALTRFLDSAKGRGLEERLYPFIVSLYTAVLTLLDEHDPLPDDHSRKALKLAFSQNHPTHLVDAVIKDQSPDIRALFDTFTVDKKKLAFYNIVHCVEVKDTDLTLCRGNNDFRVIHEGRDPLQGLRPRRKGNQASAPDSGQASPAASDGTNSKPGKRARQDDDTDDRDSDLKISRQSGETLSVSRKADTKTQFCAQAQCARYAMEHLSNVILRSHSILTLFDRDRIQFEYFDRSVIAVSTAVDLLTEQGQNLFILMVYGLRRLSPEDLGLRNIVNDSLALCRTFESAAKGVDDGGTKTWHKMFYDVKMTIAGEEYTLKDIIFRQPGLIGRTTCVVEAIRSTGDEHVVVKFSCPAKTRVSETDLVQRARQCAESDEKHAWVLKHLPNIIASEDVDIGADSVQARMRDFLNDAEYADKQKYHYEDRCLRITVSERLHPITCLTSPREVAQVFLDVLQTHNWLYEVPKILHRDLSQSNIMFRKDKDANVYGVPNDLDLASLLSQIEGESSSTSLRRTGTPPFMAFDLQDPDNSQVRHLYRHDLESLFYVLVMFVCRYEYKGDRYVMRAKPPFEDWFDWTKSWADLKKTKGDFFHETKRNAIKTSIAPGFEDFEHWVISIWSVFGKGFRNRQDAEAPIPSFIPNEKMLQAIKAGLLEAPVVEQPLKTDDETLGGKVTYWSFYKYMVRLGGEPLDERCPSLGLPGQ